MDGGKDVLGKPPRIGLTSYREPASWGAWAEPADLLPASYSDAIAAAGGVALLLPPSPLPGEMAPAAQAVLDGLHGLLLSGGPDVDPARYGAERDGHTGPPRPERDEWELTLARAALGRGMPLLGVCRGMQVLAVALGGTLVQHLPDSVGNAAHCPTPGIPGRHPVKLAAGSVLAGLLGDLPTVATYHHQAVDHLPAGAVATGWASDGTIEAFEVSTNDSAWTVGVQWHPEAHDGEALFNGFVDVCAAARGPLGTR